MEFTISIQPDINTAVVLGSILELKLIELNRLWVDITISIDLLILDMKTRPW